MTTQNCGRDTGQWRIYLQLTPGGVMVTDRMDIEAILPMGHLVHDLGCEVCWKDCDLSISHPHCGPLPVRNQEGCPQLPRALALELIEKWRRLDSTKEREI